MNNFLSLVVALFEHSEILTRQEAEKLIKDLQGSTLPDTYQSASKLIEDLFSKYDIGAISQKLKLTDLEARLRTDIALVEGKIKVDTKK